jgi:hypothetical protein
MRRQKLKQFIEDNSFYDVDLRPNLDTEGDLVRNLRLDKINRTLLTQAN